MRYGIPLLKNRVSPRCTIADAVMLVSCDHGRLKGHRVVYLESGAWVGLIQLLIENKVDTIVAGGIDRETRQLLTSYGLNIIDNVACSADEVLKAVAQNRLQPGYGFSEKPSDFSDASSTSDTAGRLNEQNPTEATWSWETQGDQLVSFDCLNCSDRACLRGEPCYPSAAESFRESAGENQTALDVARDISFEEDRQLCRVAELVYFCLGMKYRRLGVAYCIDLMEPAGVLTGLLRRFFDVFPVCCKVGGIQVADPLTEANDRRAEAVSPRVACNPVGQAGIFNSLNTDINIIVGLCIGVDCLFMGASRAPVTTIFVKDKSLVNNPIGAIYSDYHLNEVTRTPTPEKALDNKGGLYI